jgi:hypothetical protein
VRSAEDDETKAALLTWRKDGQDYYKAQAALSQQGRYIPVQSEAHLWQFAYPQKLIKIIRDISPLEADIH